ncbi:hypothetical protein [Sulfuracidifex tepidarius]|uniref:Uncharacterized protein n=1 Tax=Sulfuracidifex tepidarius TaxID=1294262 RepID=A0A510DYS8_9CREN|nr:hypothetical protein [Sulfuracidifex tepidarius]BBG25392.1 hypothetical protein IC006_2728 [Sulfuracidifex tepidarius]BBG28186.1 hypothetical protein IC007_2742 [Sulfuracidifex tepidarius]
MLQFTGERITVKELDIETKPDYIVYDDAGYLPASSYARGLSSLLFFAPKVYNVHEFTYTVAPYCDLGKVVAFVGDEENVVRITDTLRYIEASLQLFTWKLPQGLEKKGGDVNITLFEGNKYGSVSLAFSILASLSKLKRNPRTERILEQLSDFSDLQPWLDSLGQGIDVSRYQVILSPIMEPASFHLRKAGLDVKTMANYNILINSLIIYNGSDMMSMRRVITMMSSKGVETKQILLDSDPLMAPSYLTIKMGA